MLSSVRSAIRVVALFTTDSPVLGVTEIARKLNLAKSTASRLTTTLCAENVLSATPNGKYRLSIGLVSVGLVAAQSHSVYEAGREALIKIRAETGLGAHLSIIDGTELAQLCRVTSDYLERLGKSRPRQPILPTSAGKAILAFSEPELVERYLGTNRQNVWAALQTVRKRGYAISRNDYVANVVGVAVPILGDDGLAVAALTVLGPSRQFSDERVNQTARLLTSSARAITAAIF
jgi:IclR family transcriptional regulator, KDG regulon repressor